MAFIVDENGNITLVQGDTGEYVVSGLPNDKQTYVLYLAITDEKRNPIGDEIYVPTLGSTSVTFTFTSTLTDLLTVKPKEDTATYNFGIKLCDGTTLEDTLLLGNSQIGDVNTITVYPKKVEGTING